MTDTYVSYTPGGWTLLARNGRYLLVEAVPTEAAVSRVWASWESGNDLAGAMSTVENELPQRRFCLIHVDGGTVHLAQDGVAAALDGRAVKAERAPVRVPVPDEGGMLTAAGDFGASGLQLPIEGGVVAAGAVFVVQVDSGDDVAPEAAPVSVEPEPVAVEPAPIAVEPAPVPVPLTSIFAEPEPDPEPEPTSVFAETEPVDEPSPALWAEVPPLEADPQPEDTPEELPEDLPEDDEPLTDTATVLAPPPVPHSPEVPIPDPSGATVLAGFCLNGHATGAYAPTCRVCGDDVPEQSPRSIPRPSLGALVLANGEKVDLARSAILGRAPHVPGDADEEPQLVNLAAYGRDISRQHAEVIVHGWSVFVRDLGSANGTRIRTHDGQVLALTPGVAVPLAPDGVIEIAEVTTLEYRTAG
ncbi:hypothetical protein ABIE44_001162 [Marmoricola sp. OAE513]|uniref:FHA domain-containing protein n=1 Tax=Marmoricola sp. OAE513 TaxID=2817894 RepID=UPI001AEA379E